MDRGHVHDLRIRAGRVRRDRVRLFLDYSPDMKGVAVPDPYGRDAADYRRAFELIEAGCIDLVDALVAAKVAQGYSSPTHSASGQPSAPARRSPRPPNPG